MAEHKRGLKGAQAATKGGLGEVVAHVGARDNTKDAKFWVSHRQGPFLIHKVGGCEQEPRAGYSDDYDNLIGQGFAPCPQCIGGAK